MYRSITDKSISDILSGFSLLLYSALNTVYGTQYSASFQGEDLQQFEVFLVLIKDRVVSRYIIVSNSVA